MSLTFTAKSFGAGVKESIIINNRIRIKLKLTMEEYALCNSIADMREKGKPVGKYVLYKETGIHEDGIPAMLEVLVQKGVLERKAVKDKQLLYPSALWSKQFEVADSFDNDDDTNPGLWQIFLKRGNKQAALRAYKKAIKIVSPEVLKQKAADYIASKDGEQMKHIMHASTFLNPDDRHWEDEFQTGKLEKQKGVLDEEWPSR